MGRNRAEAKGSYDYIVVGGGAAGSVLAGELPKTGADVLLVHDPSAIVRAIEAARELGRQSALDAVREAEAIPGPNAAGKDLVDLARTAASSFGHPVGTARMGADADAVVDSNLRVRNVRGLRVADASMMPSITCGATNAPSIMIGGRAAMLITGSVACALREPHAAAEPR
jgi:choline dehydrogenase-like flavoprotein